jgi:hypothetical protein
LARLEAVLRAFAAICFERGRGGEAMGALVHTPTATRGPQDRVVELVTDMIAGAAREGSVDAQMPPAELARFAMHALMAASTAADVGRGRARRALLSAGPSRAAACLIRKGQGVHGADGRVGVWARWEPDRVKPRRSCMESPPSADMPGHSRARFVWLVAVGALVAWGGGFLLSSGNDRCSDGDALGECSGPFASAAWHGIGLLFMVVGLLVVTTTLAAAVRAKRGGRREERPARPPA